MYARQVLCSALIARDDEMQAIERAVREARSGRGGSLLFAGEAGVGKSRLAREAAALAELAGMRVLQGRCVEGGQVSPYRPLAEALLGALRGQAPPETAELRPFKPVLGRLIPDWRSDAAAEQSVVLLGEGILRLLRALAGSRGSLLILEDLHWADPETLALIDYLAANVAGEPLLLLGTLRTGEPSAALALAGALRDRRQGQVWELPRLDDAGVGQMAAACLGAADLPDSVAAALSAAADGLPLLVEDLLAEWLADGQLSEAGGRWRAGRDLAAALPVSFAETVRRRLVGLDPDALRLLRLAALLGRRFDWRVAAAAAGLDDEAALLALQRAIQLQLVAVESQHGQDAFRFRHALTQAAVIADLLPPQRARLAAGLLAAIREIEPGLPGEWCDVAARLAEDSGDRARAASLLRESGCRALAAGALSTAEATLTRAAALCEPDSSTFLDVEEQRIEALALAGKQQEVATAGGRLLEALDRQGAPAAERRARAHLRIARACVAASAWPAAREHLETARQLAESAPALLPSLDALLAHVAIGQGQTEEARALAAAALDGAERAGQWEVACEALEVAGRAARERDLAEAEVAFDRARGIAERYGLTVWRLRALHELGTIDLFTPGATADRLRETRALAAECGALALTAIVDVQLAAAYIAVGDFAAVREVAGRSAALAQRLGLDVTRAVALLFVSEAFARCGPDRPAMEAAIADCLAAATADPAFEMEAQAMIWADTRASASLIEENRERALAELDKAQEFFRRVRGGAPSPGRGIWALLKTVQDDGGREACREVAASAVMVHPINQAYVRYAGAIEAGREGRLAEASEAAAAADALLAGSYPWMLHFARRFVAEEALARGWGDPATWLAEAADYFHQLAPRFASACRSLLRKAGAAPARTPRAHAGVPAVFRARGVTEREMEVLSILCEGLTNREIGERLYLSPKTVEKHVSSLMDKLDVRSRAQLAAIAASGALPT